MTHKGATDRFFQGLQAVCAEIAGEDDPLTLSAAKAVDDPSSVNRVMAQEQLAQISEERREEIMRKLHSRMRNDIEAIWDQMPHAKPSGRPN